MSILTNTAIRFAQILMGGDATGAVMSETVEEVRKAQETHTAAEFKQHLQSLNVVTRIGLLAAVQAFLETNLDEETCTAYKRIESVLWELV